jgi:hypothetical protein
MGWMGTLVVALRSLVGAGVVMGWVGTLVVALRPAIDRDAGARSPGARSLGETT